MANDPYWNNVVLAMHMDDVGLSDLKGQFYRLEQNGSSRAACRIDEDEALACLNAAKLRGNAVTVVSYSNF